MVHAELATSIGKVIGATLHRRPLSRVHGGSINECYRWDSDVGPIFVKIAPARRSGMFAAEAAGLEELRRADSVRVPRVLGVGPGPGADCAAGVGADRDPGADCAAGVGADRGPGVDCVAGVGADRGPGVGNAWLALEWIESGTPSRATDSILGEQLAKQHRVTQAAFGWSRDNTIGSTPQLNEWCDDWVTFFRDRRLRYQLDLAARNGFGGRLQQRGGALLDRVAEFFSGYLPVPSLLHGDLWGGNRLTADRGHPVIFDPAVYYGDRETDLAMTRLFGGFGPGFYAAYEAAWQLDAGAGERTDLYNLYHVLNHLNLFGDGYLGQALAMIQALLAGRGG
jgi:fructosamine-3-kinase